MKTMNAEGRVPYRGEEFYDLRLEAIHRRLPVVKIGAGLWIASFVMLGDVGLTEQCAGLLAARLAPGFDAVVAPEAKAIPLAHTVARIAGGPGHGVPYCVIRKSRKAYSKGGITHSVKSITTKERQLLYLDGNDAARLNGKRVCLIDDVISTGETIKACAELVNMAGGMVHQMAAVLLEGDADALSLAGYAQNGLAHLGRIPVFVAGGCAGPVA